MPKILPFRETSPSDPLVVLLAEEDADRRRLRRALAGALFLHLGLLVVTVPKTFSEPPPPPPAEDVFRIEEIRIRPPEPPPDPRKPEIRRAEATIPVPDLDPTEPETPPVEEPVVELTVPDLVSLLALPEPPEEPLPSDEPIAVAGDVVAPERLVAPPPGYTETARRARIQGDVVVQAVIDRDGRVRELEVLKGLPFGLTERAVATVEGWTFRPATLGGAPVTVRYVLKIRFRLQ